MSDKLIYVYMCVYTSIYIYLKDLKNSVKMSHAQFVFIAKKYKSIVLLVQPSELGYN